MAERSADAGLLTSTRVAGRHRRRRWRSMQTVDDFSVGLVTNIVSSLLGAIGRRIGNEALGDTQERELGDVFRRASAALLVELVRDDVGNCELLERYEGQFGTFVGDAWVAETLVGVALDREELPVEGLRTRFSAIGFDPDALSVGFDRAMAVFVRELLAWLEDNASSGGSLRALVDRADLRAIRGSVEAIARGPGNAGQDAGGASGPPPRPADLRGQVAGGIVAKRAAAGRPGRGGGVARGIRGRADGAPGIGKTALATVATAGEGVLRAFPGGTFWVFLGPDPDVVEEPGGLARRLGAVVHKRPRDLAEDRE